MCFGLSLPCVTSLNADFRWISIDNVCTHQDRQVLPSVLGQFAKVFVQILGKKLCCGYCTIGMRTCEKNGGVITGGKRIVGAYYKSIIHHDLTIESMSLIFKCSLVYP